MERDREDEHGTAAGAWPSAAARARAAAFLDLWERQVSEHARRGPERDGDAQNPAAGAAAQ